MEIFSRLFPITATLLSMWKRMDVVEDSFVRHNVCVFLLFFCQPKYNVFVCLLMFFSELSSAISTKNKRTVLFTRRVAQSSQCRHEVTLRTLILLTNSSWHKPIIIEVVHFAVLHQIPDLALQVLQTNWHTLVIHHWKFSLFFFYLLIFYV